VSAAKPYTILNITSLGRKQVNRFHFLAWVDISIANLLLLKLLKSENEFKPENPLLKLLRNLRCPEMSFLISKGMSHIEENKIDLSRKTSKQKR